MPKVWNVKSLEVITPPVNSPVSLADAKVHLRVDGTDEDTLIQLYIDAATQSAQDFLKRALITQTLEMTMDGFVESAKLDLVWEGTLTGYRQDIEGFSDIIDVWRAPIQSVTSITTFDDDNASTVYASANYELDAKKGRIYLNQNNVWPTDLRDYAGVKVRYVAGYGDDPADVPADIRMAILQHVSQMYERCGVCEMPAACRQLLGGKRLVYL